jgi:hypothetical protein
MSETDIGQIADGMINLDMTGRGVIAKLFEAARAEAGKPLTQLAATHIVDALQKPESHALILTGFSVYQERVSESDGPVGAAALARTLDRAFKCKSSVVIERKFAPPMAITLRAAGLHAVDNLEDLKRGRHVAGLIDFPIDHKEAEEKADELLDEMNPSLVIAIERCGWNERHIHHNMRGFDVSEFTAKEDYLIERAKERKILTIGIGDGGNEIGMGRILGAVKKHVAFGDKCQCPCGTGLGAAFKTDVLVTANVSNWAATGICACIATMLKNIGLMHDGATEKRMIEACALAGAIDGVTGYAEPSVDGFPAQTNADLVDILRAAALRRITE